MPTEKPRETRMASLWRRIVVLTRSRRPIRPILQSWLVLLILALVASPRECHAESTVLRVAKQYGLGYLQLMMMEQDKLIEKAAKAAGLGDIEVSWATFRSSDVMNDAIISGSVDFVCLGPPGLATLWA